MRYRAASLCILAIFACSGGVSQFEGRFAEHDQRLNDLESRVQQIEQEKRAQGRGIKQQTAEVRLALANIDELVARVDAMTQDLDQRQQDVAVLLDDLTNRVLRLERNSSASSEGATPQIEATAKEVFDRARMDLDAGHLELAAMGFKSFIEQFPQSVLADEAQLMIGECHYAGDQFEDALNEYMLLLDQYPASDKMARAMLKSGICLLNLDREDQAVSMLRRLMEEYPGSKEARLARERLSEIR